MPVDAHEVYPNAPLALAAVEVRFPDLGIGVLSVPLQRALRDGLGSEWVIETVKTQQVTVMFGPGGVQQPTNEVTTLPRFTVRDRTLSVAVTSESLTIEATKYVDYQNFRTIVERALASTKEVLQPEGVGRVGMRYIDEIRVPDDSIDNALQWSRWIDAALFPPCMTAMNEAGFPTTGWEGAAQYETGPNKKLVLRYGPRVGYAVAPNGPLKRPWVPPPGPLFALDFDSFWEPIDLPEFDPHTLIDRCDQLRAPISTLFDLLTTEALLDQYRKERTVG